ncbi:N-acetylmuramoyl-L-alanine amidase [Pyxidicoccus sp. 3LG]
MPRATGLLGLGLALLTGLAPLRGQAQEGGAPPAPAASPAPVWPAPGAPLTVAEVKFPEGFKKRRIYLDAGHGAEGNTGNKSVTCEDEEAFTLRVAEDLARRLEATGRFRVRLSRKSGERVPYPTRVTAAESWGAHALVSLHSDARGLAMPWSPSPGQQCYRQDASPGFSVLWSEEAAAPLPDRRAELARALARHMGRAGFRYYDGVDYEGLYGADSAQPGVFVSRASEPTHRRILMLRRPSIPSVIIETHHALDLEEAARWREERTLEAFAAAVAQGLVEGLTPPVPAKPDGTAQR